MTAKGQHLLPKISTVSYNLKIIENKLLLLKWQTISCNFRKKDFDVTTHHSK